MFENRMPRKIFGHNGKEQETGENYIMRSGACGTYGSKENLVEKSKRKL
jgi:hypothetical protein